MNELWSRSVASVYDGKVEDFKRLAGDLVSTIRENDSETLDYAIFLDEPARRRDRRAVRQLEELALHDSRKPFPATSSS
jgi:hypothetical protein